MKGLLTKDFMLMKNQKAFLAAVAAVCILFLMKGSDPFFTFSYIAGMLSMLVISTLTYDEQDNGMSFLLTLPISRVSYVLEKYVFGILVTAVFIVVGSVIALAVGVAKSTLFGPQEYFTIAFGGMLVSMLLQSVMIPLQLKFGAEKSRVAMLVGIGFLGIIAYGMRRFAEIFDMDFVAVIESLSSLSPAVIGLCIGVLALVSMGISCAISVTIMKGKQF